MTVLSAIRKTTIWGMAAAVVAFAPYGTLVRGVKAVSNAVLSDQTRALNQLVLVDQDSEIIGDELGIRAMYPQATIIHGHFANLNQIMQTITDHVRHHGPLDEIAIEGHSIPNRFFFSREPGGRFTTYEFLNRLIQEQQRQGQQIVRRVVFLGCNVFTDQTAQSVNFYREASRTLGAEISGTTTRLWQGIYQSAYFVVVRPDGRVQSDDKLNVWEPAREVAALHTRYVRKNRDNILQIAR